MTFFTFLREKGDQQAVYITTTTKTKKLQYHAAKKKKQRKRKAKSVRHASSQTKRALRINCLHQMCRSVKKAEYEVCVFQVCIFYRFLDTPKKGKQAPHVNCFHKMCRSYIRLVISRSAVCVFEVCVFQTPAADRWAGSRYQARWYIDGL